MPKTEKKFELDYLQNDCTINASILSADPTYSNKSARKNTAQIVLTKSTL